MSNRSSGCALNDPFRIQEQATRGDDVDFPRYTVHMCSDHLHLEVDTTLLVSLYIVDERLQDDKREYSSAHQDNVVLDVFGSKRWLC
jgi:hypothetical protein